MKKLISAISIFIFATFAYSDDLIWHDNFNDALDQAEQENKYVLADFTGSDWCPWCIKLEEEVFDKPEFASYAKDNLVLFKADFPESKEISPEIKKQNDQLQDKYKVEGFPTVLILDKNSEVIVTMGYEEGGAVSYVASIKKGISDYNLQN